MKRYSPLAVGLNKKLGRKILTSTRSLIFNFLNCKLEKKRIFKKDRIEQSRVDRMNTRRALSFVVMELYQKANANAGVQLMSKVLPSFLLSFLHHGIIIYLLAGQLIDFCKINNICRNKLNNGYPVLEYLLDIYGVKVLLMHVRMKTDMQPYTLHAWRMEIILLLCLNGGNRI